MPDFVCQIEGDDNSRRTIPAQDSHTAAMRYCDQIDPPDGAIITVGNGETGENSYGVTRRVVYGVSEV